jgi:toxin secretion/phage lysis holin
MRDFSIDLVWAKVQMAFAAIGGWLGYFLGGADGLLITLLVFMVLDYITGVMCGIVDKKLSSAVGFKGLFRKMLIIALVGVGHVVDMHVIGTGGALRSAVICFYLSNEGVSMLENAAHLGLPVPDKLKDILVQLHNRDDKGETTDVGDGE